jgi:hypothetical protein
MNPLLGLGFTNPGLLQALLTPQLGTGLAAMPSLASNPMLTALLAAAGNPLGHAMTSEPIQAQAPSAPPAPAAADVSVVRIMSLLDTMRALQQGPSGGPPSK